MKMLATQSIALERALVFAIAFAFGAAQLAGGVVLLGVLTGLVVGGVTAAASVRRSAVLAFALFSVTWVAFRVAAPQYQFWPWIMVVPLSVVFGVQWLTPRYSQLFWRIGDINRRTVSTAAAVALLSCGALWLWLEWMAPDLSIPRSLLPSANAGVMALALAGFAVLNALIEELIFRGLVQEAFLTSFPVAVAVGAQGALFALAHAIGGVPDGPTGVVLTFIYGTALGALRQWSKGLAVPLGVHVVTDLFIGVVLVFWRG